VQPTPAIEQGATHKKQGLIHWAQLAWAVQLQFQKLVDPLASLTSSNG
jgi:hypothetical protein